MQIGLGWRGVLRYCRLVFSFSCLISAYAPFPHFIFVAEKRPCWGTKSGLFNVVGVQH